VEEDERLTMGAEALREGLISSALASYEAKVSRLGPDLAHQLERHVVLRTIDELWKDHLHELDILRGGIGLRAYGQKDPLLEYKGESFRMFEEMITRSQSEIVSRFFRMEVAMAPPPPEAALAGGRATKAEAGGLATAQAPAASAVGTSAATAGARRAFDESQSPDGGGGETVVRDAPKVGRNDPCPCGSGKKYKKCHGAA
jgi:preprotein translocase subunit SecA